MHITLIALAGRPTPWVADATANYQKRLPKAWRFEIKLLPPTRKPGAGEAEARKLDEWQRVEKTLSDDDVLVLLDERGESLSSRQLAKKVSGWQRRSVNLKFLVGGPDGVCDGCRTRASLVISLSAMTLPHEMARVMLVEQLYRANAIIEGHPYHRD